ncbi:MAG: GNAT family N-acetyltransferase [Acidimicrobiales bacterium]
MAAATADGTGVPDLLTAHLAEYLGAWPPRRQPVDVVGSPRRLERAWDGATVPIVVVSSPQGAVVSAPPGLVPAVMEVATDIRADTFRTELARAAGRPGRASPWVVLRWSTAPADLPEDGVWLDSADPVLPGWLHAFPGRVLAILDDDGSYLAGVGIKAHTALGKELAVGTSEAARGRGLARRAVAQAARAVLDEGAIPLYVHAADNEPSARVANAAGFPDLGLRLLAVWG